MPPTDPRYLAMPRAAFAEEFWTMYYLQRLMRGEAADAPAGASGATATFDATDAFTEAARALGLVCVDGRWVTAPAEPPAAAGEFAACDPAVVDRALGL